jgi:hypothetical protein
METRFETTTSRAIPQPPDSESKIKHVRGFLGAANLADRATINERRMARDLGRYDRSSATTSLPEWLHGEPSAPAGRQVPGSSREHKMHKSREPDCLLHILAAERRNDFLRKTHQRLAGELRFHDCVLGCAYE